MLKGKNGINVVFMCILLCFLLYRALTSGITCAEIDSNALPVISLQYRGSILVNQSDILKAQSDFPELYNGVNSYDDLRSSKLLKVTDNKWMPWYFPIYPFFCIPVKILLSIFRLNQIKTFNITNALLIYTAFWFVLFKLKKPLCQRIIAFILLFLSPAVLHYYNYVNYEVFIFSMLTISLVLYSNGKRKSSAFALSLAGMSNSAVMAVGIVMVCSYLLHLLRVNWKKTFLKIIRDNFWDAFEYAFCFIPCLIPFILQKCFLHSLTFSANTTNFKGIIGRFLMYLFDPTLGIPTFAPLCILFFCVCVILGGVQRQKEAFEYGSFLAGTVLAVSLMPHINCGMIFCARYVAWIYPIVPIFLATAGYEIISFVSLKKGIYLIIIISTVVFQYINYGDILPYHFNTVTKWILNNIPELYNPIASTFYCRTKHIDGAYNITSPAYYVDSVQNEVRKIIYKADAGAEETILSELDGYEAGMEYLANQIETIGIDGKYHYINLPQGRSHKIHKKSLAEIQNLEEGPDLVMEQDFYLDAGSELQCKMVPFSIRENTIYKIELELAADFDTFSVENMYVDFYAPTYDRADQEENVLTDKYEYNYMFYFDSGEVTDLQEVMARIICVTDKSINAEHIAKFRVTEMRPEHTD